MSVVTLCTFIVLSEKNRFSVNDIAILKGYFAY